MYSQGLRDVFASYKIMGKNPALLRQNDSGHIW